MNRLQPSDQNMDQIKRIPYFILLLSVYQIRELYGDVQVCDEIPNSGTKDILAALDKEASSFPDKNLAIIFGTRRSERSFLVKIITGDNNKLISGKSESEFWKTLNFNSTSVIESSLQNLLHIDVKTGTQYLEFPAFNNEETFSVDFISKYYTWRIINQAHFFKFILTVDSLKKAPYIDMAEFSESVQNAAKFIGNIDKFNHSIALVVTNFDNSDTELAIKNNIAQELQSAYKVSIRNKDEKVAKLILALLTTNENQDYNKIGILTTFEQQGVVSNNASSQNKTKNLRRFIETIQFASNHDINFDYKFLSKLRAEHEHEDLVDALWNQVKRRIDCSRLKINKEILEYFEKQEAASNSTQDSRDYFANLSITLDQFEQKLPKGNDAAEESTGLGLEHDEEVLGHVAKLLRDFKIGVLEHGIPNISNSYKYLRFIEAYNHPRKSILQTWEMGEVDKFIKESVDWYTFLLDLYSFLSDLEVQKHRVNNTINLEEIRKACGERKVVDLDKVLSYFSSVQSIDRYKIERTIDSYKKTKNVDVNERKLDQLCKIYDKTLVEETKINCFGTTLEIEGQFMRFDQIPPNNYCPGGIKRVELFALDTVFINTDLDRTGLEFEIVVIAPKWIVYGVKKITLDGSAGKRHEPPTASDGDLEGGKGADGAPGLPGGPAGSFLGIGMEISGAYPGGAEIIISANGGNGGKGQNGGNGAKGKNGEDGAEEFELVFRWKTSFEGENFENCTLRGRGRHCVVHRGTKGQPNGDGGDGGKGGLPGSAGFINFFLPNDTGGVHIRKYSEDGWKGKGGIGGKGGYGSVDGKTRFGVYHSFYPYFPVIGLEGIVTEHKVVLPRGHDGLPDENAEGMQNASTAFSTGFARNVNRYRRILREEMRSTFRKTELMSFYEKVDYVYSLVARRNILEIL